MIVHNQNFKKFSYKQLQKISKGGKTDNEKIFLRLFFYKFAMLIHCNERYSNIFLTHCASKQKYRFTSFEYASFKNPKYALFLNMERIIDSDERDLFLPHLKEKPNMLCERLFGNLGFNLDDPDFVIRTTNIYNLLLPDPDVRAELEDRYIELQRLSKAESRYTNSYNFNEFKRKCVEAGFKMGFGERKKLYENYKKLYDEREQSPDKAKVFDEWVDRIKVMREIKYLEEQNRDITIKDFGFFKVYNIDDQYHRVVPVLDFENNEEPHNVLNDIPTEIYANGKKIKGTIELDKLVPHWRETFVIEKTAQFLQLRGRWEQVGVSEMKEYYEKQDKEAREYSVLMDTIRNEVFTLRRELPKDDLIKFEEEAEKLKEKYIEKFVTSNKVDYKLYKIHCNHLELDDNNWVDGYKYKDGFDGKYDIELISRLSESIEEIFLGY